MMKEILIVDGYNIIGAWPELQKLKEINLEDARDRLIDILADYQAWSGMKIFLVFDAHQVPGQGGMFEQSRLHVQFTREKETADEVIERIISRFTGRTRRVFVATSDLLEQHVAFGRGALRLPARELLEQVRQSQQAIGGKLRDHSARVKNTVDSKLSPGAREQFERLRRGE